MSRGNDSVTNKISVKFPEKYIYRSNKNVQKRSSPFKQIP